MSGGERAIEQRARLLEAVETPREPRTDVERARAVGRQRHSLGGDPLGPVVVRDPAEQVAAHEQKLRQREQVFEGRTFDPTTLQALDRRREVGDARSGRSYSVRRRS